MSTEKKATQPSRGERRRAANAEKWRRHDLRAERRRVEILAEPEPKGRIYDKIRARAIAYAEARQEHGYPVGAIQTRARMPERRRPTFWPAMITAPEFFDRCTRAERWRRACVWFRAEDRRTIEIFRAVIQGDKQRRPLGDLLTDIAEGLHPIAQHFRKIAPERIAAVVEAEAKSAGVDDGSAFARLVWSASMVLRFEQGHPGALALATRLAAALPLRPLPTSEFVHTPP